MPRALPLLYPAAPPSVFAFGKYTALAVALVREYEVGFLWVILVEIMVWGFSTRETTGGVARTSLYSGLVVLALFVDLAIHLPSRWSASTWWEFWWLFVLFATD